MFTKEAVCSAFKGEIIGREIIYLESTASTMDTAIEIGSQRNDPDGIVVIADSQTGGRGRLGRCWISPPGVNLYFSVLLKPAMPLKELSLITLAAGVAVASAIRKYTGLRAEIKWPNDILIKGKKAGGILTESRAEGDRVRLLVLGIGINVNMPLNLLGSDIEGASTSLKSETGTSVDRAGLFSAILSELENYYKILLNGDKRALINEWLSLNSTIGKSIRVQNCHMVLSGVAEALNDEGELILRLASGETKTVSAGDVTILKR